MAYQYSDSNRQGDHIWYVTDLSKFKAHYPDWKITNGIASIMEEIADQNKERWLAP
ncbi:hypothetical protein N6H14_18920 [Paenibacillus sp. CC-CFT747]|nr:hypothetical protein N6H14_18920 [Paenibacillus sp. CC-CFT747]